MRRLVAAAWLFTACPVTDPGVLCRDGRVDGTETDLDCGGDCGGCTAGLLCLGDGDCVSGVCSRNRCGAPSCDDGVRNGIEDGVDCGGPCPACTGGCVRNSDCGAGVCFDGTCGAGPCSAPLRTCAQLCVDPRVNPLHCGGCGQPCLAEQACVGGICRSVCTGGTQSCGSACFDVRSDPLHCGVCTRACAAGDVCVGGDCYPRCSPPQLDCSGVCVSPDRDALHCGGCMRPCAPGTGCLNGQCTPTCSPPLLPCDGGACVDPRFDPMNCGGCGLPCPPVPNAKPACTPMGCTRSECDPGFADCDAGTGDGCETQLGNDPNNCGACGRFCFGAESCVLGRCCGPPPQGSYLSTCSACEACNGLLTCMCDDSMQIPRAASLMLNPPCTGDITNCNGVLLCNGC